MQLRCARIVAAQFARTVLNRNQPHELPAPRHALPNLVAPTSFFTKSQPLTNNFFKIASAIPGQARSIAISAPHSPRLRQL
jgi:hypothetical protein